MRAALITGGGSGIGLRAAEHLLRDGCAVTLMGRSEERVRAAAEKLGEEARWSAGSVDDEDAVRRAVEVADADGELDVAVLAAGAGTGGPLLMGSREDWDATMATNLTGAFLTIKHAGQAMAQHGGGSIIALSSIAGVRTHRFMTPYCVSKAGLEMLVMNAADELGPMGIRVNAVRPGLVPTDLSAGLVASEPIVRDYLSQMPVGRLGTTDDIAAAIRYLAGEESGWVTGVCLSVDGGHHLRRGPWLDVS
ncbi:MAG TPA: SDR family oxidoreductase [Acidimicrobiales bacterium]|nr:SDR family oxidoreductase [Acidimicrobiales bacterium]